jgi:hypothetical protein
MIKDFLLTLIFILIIEAFFRHKQVLEICTAFKLEQDFWLLQRFQKIIAIKSFHFYGHILTLKRLIKIPSRPLVLMVTNLHYCTRT